MFCSYHNQWFLENTSSTGREVNADKTKYSSAPVSTCNTLQNLPRLRETVDNTERYIFVLTYINTIKFYKLRTVRHYQH
jgi:hypothetical protein